MGFRFEEAGKACQKWFSEDFEEEADGVAVAWHGMALRKKMDNFEEEADGLDEREKIVNYTTGKFFKYK